jgi:acetyl-CoA C-acetyltransferase
MHEVVIAGAVRTAIGRLGGSLASTPAPRLGAVVLKEALSRTGLEPSAVEEVIMGHVIQAGTGLNSARQASLRAGVPVSVPAFTVNKVCASGMKAISLAALAIASGEQRIVAAGGMENMSAAPFLLAKAREGYRLGDSELLDAILSDALRDPTCGCHMGMTAENLAAEFEISREEQDEFAAVSQRKTAQAMRENRFEAEIVSVSIPQRKGEPLRFAVDEFPRPETSVEALSALKPAFKTDGTVTAGNASGINDGAAAMLLLSADEARKRDIQPQARILSYASAALEPERMGMGPVEATRGALQRAGLALSEIDVIELNEAFAAQSLAVMRELDLDPARVNLNGGAIALGHPVGASGARILVTLLHVLAQRKKRLGLATLCVGGGQGMALIVETL